MLLRFLDLVAIPNCLEKISNIHANSPSNYKALFRLYRFGALFTFSLPWILPIFTLSGSLSRIHGAYMTNETLEKALTSPDLKVIPNYSRYAVDIFGNVYSISYNKTGEIKMMKQRKNRYGYMQVQLFDDNKKSKLLSVHRLVAISFIPFIKGKEYINHIDGNKSNNNFLIWNGAILAKTPSIHTRQSKRNHTVDFQILVKQRQKCVVSLRKKKSIL